MKNSFRNLSYQELRAKREELARKYMELRFQAVIGHLENPVQKRTMRRQIARLNTLIHQQEKAQALENIKSGSAGQAAALPAGQE